MALCPGLPRWATTRRNIYPLIWGHPWGDTWHLLDFMVQREDNRGRHTNILSFTSIIWLGTSTKCAELHTWWLRSVGGKTNDKASGFVKVGVSALSSLQHFGTAGSAVDNKNGIRLLKLLLQL